MKITTKEYVETTPVTRVAAAVLWKGDRFLAARRPDGKSRGGFWEFPGGKQEPGEEMQNTLIRELREELDLTVVRAVPWKVFRHQYSDMLVELHFMHVHQFSGTPFPLDGQELRWLTPEEARALPFLPADREILEELKNPERDKGDD